MRGGGGGPTKSSFILSPFFPALRNSSCGGMAHKWEAHLPNEPPKICSWRWQTRTPRWMELRSQFSCSKNENSSRNSPARPFRPNHPPSNIHAPHNLRCRWVEAWKQWKPGPLCILEKCVLVYFQSSQIVIPEKDGVDVRRPPYLSQNTAADRPTKGRRNGNLGRENIRIVIFNIENFAKLLFVQRILFFFLAVCTDINNNIQDFR